MAHPNKHIREAIDYAKNRGWRYEEGGKGHTKGKLYCGHGHSDCHFLSTVRQETLSNMRGD